MAGIIDGRRIARRVYGQIKDCVRGCKIGIVRTQAEDASIYAGVIKKNAAWLSVECKEICLGMNSTLQEVQKAIESLRDTDGIVLMGFKHLPLEEVYSLLPEEKDIEGMCARHLGYLYGQGRENAPVPCTPAAVIRIIDEVGFELAGKDVCVINHSPVIGKPLSTMLLNRNATVSVCHAFTKDLAYYTKNAELVICAVGIPNFLKAEQVKPGAFVVDCGMNRKDGKIVGDVDFEGLVKICSYITPVPGGVGPVTTSILFQNLAILKEGR
ncbi:MAG: bifunctional 5,10-methylenetetrahydrofolate dehydrogenase/5,10-methenyltetrahydrofolate cyclohydrolase [Thermoplasmata archaeon]